jgi:hypothetical protein
LSEVAITREERERRDAELWRARREDGGYKQLLTTRARDIERDGPPPPVLNHQERLQALRSGARRRSWASYHRRMAELHRAAMTDLIAHHEAAAENLEAGM